MAEEVDGGRVPDSNGGRVPDSNGGRVPDSEPGMTQGADASRAVYVISVAAELAGVHPQTLRIYERKGLLDPRRTSGGSRRFSEHDLSKLRRIQSLVTEGLNLKGVSRVLQLEAEVAMLQRELDDQWARARQEAERIHRQYRRDLVPLNQSPVPYRGGSSMRRGG
jgi:MerR family transcriptional regulator, heat shock protein HspR